MMAVLLWARQLPAELFMKVAKVARVKNFISLSNGHNTKVCLVFSNGAGL
jgi:hypothetical protein